MRVIAALVLTAALIGFVVGQSRARYGWEKQASPEVVRTLKGDREG